MAGGSNAVPGQELRAGGMKAQRRSSLRHQKRSAVCRLNARQETGSMEGKPRLIEYNNAANRPSRAFFPTRHVRLISSARANVIQTKGYVVSNRQ